MKLGRVTIRSMMIAMVILTLILRFVVSPLIDYYRLPPETRAIMVLLNGPNPITPVGSTRLETFLKTIRGTTAGPFPPNGIPIYVDPRGLDEAGSGIDAKLNVAPGSASLFEAMDQALRPTGLGYFVEDGLLTVTSKKAADRKLIEKPKTARRR